ncbi:MAG TPA: transglutaminase family protein [Phycisphaerales bacterium]|nr:transglutaminase family protein [Phycisphaerales bacterium]HRQ74373.1 transglutaminase family protein [Phycisphaerales bacterium]
MLIRIRHQLRYTYDRPVLLEPMTVRLTPRQDATQRLLQHEFRVTPAAQGAACTLEPDGTNANCLWFVGQHATFTVSSESLVETLRSNPFDYLITHNEAITLPASYPTSLTHVLAPYRSEERDATVQRWADDVCERSQHDTLQFLSLLTQDIHSMFHVINRPKGDPFTPQRTLTERTGACRDVAMLFIAACRSQGLAARFISGYSLHHPPEVTEHELHAWVEVYLPGGGWRGYDPSLGLAVADGHVAVASGPDHRLAAPIAGSFRGTGVRSTLEYDITISAVTTK